MKKQTSGPTALNRIKKLFPQVTKVVDARRSIRISVTKQDSASARKKDPYGCALVRACVRQKIADAAIVGIGSSYLIKGTRAIRYKTSTAVAREITSFDRHQDFAEGNDYLLSKISPGARMGAARLRGKPTGKSHPHSGSGNFPIIKHHTADVRVIRRHK